MSERTDFNPKMSENTDVNILTCPKVLTSPPQTGAAGDPRLYQPITTSYDLKMHRGTQAHTNLGARKPVWRTVCDRSG